MNYNSLKLTALISACFIGQVWLPNKSVAQINKVAEAQSRFSDANAIYLKKSYEYIISIEEGVLKGICKVNEQKYINKETGIKYNSRQISVDAFTEAKNIKAFTMVPGTKPGKYTKKAVDKVELEDDLSGYAFYDDQKAYKLNFPYVQPGAILNLSYQIEYKELRFIGAHYWVDYLPIMENELIIRVPKNVSIGYKLFNCENDSLNFSREEKKEEIVYTWKTKNTPSINYYENAPNFRYYEPHMLFYITNYEVNNQTNKLLGDTKDLYTWYNSLLKNLNVTEDQQLQKITDSLVQGMTNEKEKVEKIFYWVQDNISYVAFEDGLGGFIPRDAGVVCYRKFGDCKDMASIICEMLRFAGIPAYHTWIGSRDIPYDYETIATPFVDNHMIATYRDENGNWNFLDATGKKASMSLYTSMIQGKQALVGIDKDSFLIVNVPVKDTSVSQTFDTTYITLENESIVGNGNVTLTGYDGLFFFYRTQRLDKNEYQDFFKAYFSKGSNKAIFSEVTRPSDDRGNVKLSYKFKLDNYISINKNELYVNLNMNNNDINSLISDSRTVPLEFEYKTKKTFVTELTLPDGYSAQYIPSNEKYENEFVGFSSSYQTKSNKIIHTFSYFINFLILPTEDFEKFNDIVKEHIKIKKQVVSLIKN